MNKCCSYYFTVRKYSALWECYFCARVSDREIGLIKSWYEQLLNRLVSLASKPEQCQTDQIDDKPYDYCTVESVEDSDSLRVVENKSCLDGCQPDSGG